VPDDADDRKWLQRFGFAEWMAAALNELDASYLALRDRQHKQGLAHARRAAGMGLNALLCVDFEARYGRSFTEHLHALADDARAPEEVRAAARRLLAAPAKPELITISVGPGTGSVDLAEAAKLVLVWVADRLPVA
jgi:HEPN domain-containing protein